MAENVEIMNWEEFEQKWSSQPKNAFEQEMYDEDLRNLIVFESKEKSKTSETTKESSNSDKENNDEESSGETENNEPQLVLCVYGKDKDLMAVSMNDIQTEYGLLQTASLSDLIEKLVKKDPLNVDERDDLINFLSLIQCETPNQYDSDSSDEDSFQEEHDSNS